MRPAGGRAAALVHRGGWLPRRSAPGEAAMLALGRHGVVREFADLGMDVAMQPVSESVLRA